MPRDMKSERHARLIALTEILESVQQASLDELCRMGKYSSARTVKEDISYLRRYHKAVIDYDFRSNVYIIKYPGDFIVDLNITRQEAGALMSGLKIASHFLPNMKTAAKSLRKKIDAYIPRDISRDGENLARMAVIAVPVAKVNPKYFDQLLDAMRHKYAVIIRYKSPGHDARKWAVSPYDFYFRGSSWYLAACNHVFRSLTVYRAGRISGVRPCGEEYISPAESGYSEEYISSAWYVTPGKARHKIRLHVSAYLAESLSEIELHPTQRIEEREDGSVILTAEVPSLEEAARWVMASAPGVRVIEPEELKDIVREYCRELLMT